MNGAVLLGLLVVGTAAFAQPTRVGAMVFGDEAHRSAFISSFSELLGRQHLTLDVRDTRATSVLANVEVDFTSADECRVSVSDESGRQILVRRLASGSSPQLQAEAAAHVAYSVVDELAHPLPRAVSPPPPPPVTIVETPTPPVPMPSALAVELGAAGTGRLTGGGAPLVAGVAVTLTTRLTRAPLQPHLTLAAAYNAPFSVSDDWVTLSIRSFSPRAWLGVRALQRGRFHLDAAVGGGADIWLVAPSSTELPENRLLAPGPQWSPIAAGQLTAGVELRGGVDVFLALVVDGDLRPTRYVERAGRDTQALYTPWSVRPSLMLGARFDFLGGGH